jgi:broad specificity phosphatase PhoE
VRTIVLARHGPPIWDHRTPIAGRDLAGWVAGIDAAPIATANGPSAQLLEHARACDVAAASTLRRSLESVQFVAPDKPRVVESIFREVFLPTDFRSSVRLRPAIWTTIARLRWYAGWSPGVETHTGAHARAHTAALTLDALSTERGNVMLIGHGTMNGMIGKRLLRLGWRGPVFRPRRYWAYAVYRLHER